MSAPSPRKFKKVVPGGQKLALKMFLKGRQVTELTDKEMKQYIQMSKKLAFASM